jgi:DNA repair exonuclease SbcCD ATPase subunit
MLKEQRKHLQSLESKWDHARKTYRKESQAFEASEERVQALEEAQTLAQNVAQSVQQRVHDRIARVVTQCLQSVFDEDYEFKIHFERKRGKTEARLVFQKEGREVDPLTASGGGLVDVAGFALRLACLSLTRPALRRLVVLDEPFKFVSREFRSRLSHLFHTLSEEMGFQFIMVTHISELEVGKCIRL